MADATVFAVSGAPLIGATIGAGCCRAAPSIHAIGISGESPFTLNAAPAGSVCGDFPLMAEAAISTAAGAAATCASAAIAGAECRGATGAGIATAVALRRAAMYECTTRRIAGAGERCTGTPTFCGGGGSVGENPAACRGIGRHDEAQTGEKGCEGQNMAEFPMWHERLHCVIKDG